MIAAALLKRVAARPESVPDERRRLLFRSQISRRSVFTEEKEHSLLERFLRPGDWAVVAIGTNVGHYNMLMAQLVGSTDA